MVLRSLFSNHSITSSMSCSFSGTSSPPRPVHLTSRLVFDLYLFMRVVKRSLRLRAGTANSSQLFEIIGYILRNDSSSPASRFTFRYTLARHSFHHMNVLFLIPRHDRPKEGENKRLIYKLFKTWRRKSIPRVKKSSVKWIKK